MTKFYTKILNLSWILINKITTLNTIDDSFLKIVHECQYLLQNNISRGKNNSRAVLIRFLEIFCLLSEWYNKTSFEILSKDEIKNAIILFQNVDDWIVNVHILLKTFIYSGSPILFELIQLLEISKCAIEILNMHRYHLQNGMMTNTSGLVKAVKKYSFYFYNCLKSLSMFFRKSHCEDNPRQYREDNSRQYREDNSKQYREDNPRQYREDNQDIHKNTEQHSTKECACKKKEPMDIHAFLNQKNVIIMHDNSVNEYFFGFANDLALTEVVKLIEIPIIDWNHKESAVVSFRYFETDKIMFITIIKHLTI